MTTWSFCWGVWISVCMCSCERGLVKVCWSAQTVPGSGCGWGLWTRESVRGAALSQRSRSPPHPLLAPPLPPPRAPGPAPPPSGRVDAPSAPWRSPKPGLLHCNLTWRHSCYVILSSCELLPPSYICDGSGNRLQIDRIDYFNCRFEHRFENRSEVLYKSVWKCFLSLTSEKKHKVNQACQPTLALCGLTQQAEELLTCPQSSSPTPTNRHQSHCSTLRGAQLKGFPPHCTITICSRNTRKDGRHYCPTYKDSAPSISAAPTTVCTEKNNKKQQAQNALIGSTSIFSSVTISSRKYKVAVSLLSLLPLMKI